MSSSGKGQSKLGASGDVPGAWDKAMSAGRVKQPRVIVEGEIKFDFEITLLTVRASDGAGGIATHFCAPVGHVQKDGDYIESWQPQAMSAAALKSAQAIAGAVTGALGGLWHFRRRIVREGRRGLVLRSLAASA